MSGLNRLEIFLEVAKNQSFAVAARRLGISGAAASKQVMVLEEDLGVKLLHRTTRRVTLTEEGTRYYERTTHAMDELREAAEELREHRSTPKGSLKISVPLSFGHQHLLPALAGFAKKYPELRMDVALEDRAVDVIGEGFDVVIRIGAIRDSSLVMRQLALSPFYLVASPAYLAQYGAPRAPNDLKQHRMIAYSLHGGSMEWKYQSPKGAVATVKCTGVFRANTAEMMMEAALAGVGIALLPAFSCANHLHAGNLVALLPEYHSHPERQIVALMPPNRHRTAKVSLFLDWLEQACKAMAS